MIGYSMFGFLLSDYLIHYLFFQILIICSWLGYGFYDGRWGRCIITDIQWSIKESAGLRPATESYVQYWLKYKIGLNLGEKAADMWTMGIYGVTSVIGVLRYTGVVT
jgi:hypothetical protein